MTLKDDFAAKSPITFVYGADGRVCATQRRISSSAVPLYSALMGLNSPRDVYKRQLFIFSFFKDETDIYPQGTVHS